MTEIIAHIVQPISWPQIIISVFSIVLSFIAIIISVNTYKSQVKHNKNSVRPILDIACGDYEDDISVRIYNNGVGPAIIKNIVCSNNQDSKNSLYELVPLEVIVAASDLDIRVPMFPVNSYAEDITGRTIAPRECTTLLHLANPEGNRRLAIRSVLKEITVYVEYTDIYESEIFKAERKLDFFGRNIRNVEVNHKLEVVIQ